MANRGSFPRHPLAAWHSAPLQVPEMKRVDPVTNFMEYATAEERRIVRRLLRTAHGNGVTSFRVCDGDEWHGPFSREPEILAALATTSDDIVRFYRGDKSIGWVWLIWGNGEDLVSDYSDNEEVRRIVGDTEG
jgi:hypothetical protein